MKKRESPLPRDWFHKAGLDMRRSEILLANDDAEGAAFHLQQALEKYLKGLVCGCYLAKAGMKVLICEQHYKPGLNKNA